MRFFSKKGMVTGPLEHSILLYHVLPVDVSCRKCLIPMKSALSKRVSGLLWKHLQTYAGIFRIGVLTKKIEQKNQNFVRSSGKRIVSCLAIQRERSYWYKLRQFCFLADYSKPCPFGKFDPLRSAFGFSARFGGASRSAQLCQ